MRRRKIYGLLIMIFFLAFPILANADTDPPPPNDTPIDGGLTLLIAAGVGYGVKKYRDGKKKQLEDDVKL